MFVDLFVVAVKVTISVAIMQLEVSATPMQVKVSAANMWGQFLLKLCNYAVGSLCCDHADVIFYIALCT